MRKSDIQKHNEKLKKLNLISGFIANLIIPGFGTIIFGNYEIGILQLILTVCGALLIFSELFYTPTIVIVAIMILVWLWALTTSLKEIKKKK